MFTQYALAYLLPRQARECEKGLSIPLVLFYKISLGLMRGSSVESEKQITIGISCEPIGRVLQSREKTYNKSHPQSIFLLPQMSMRRIFEFPIIAWLLQGGCPLIIMNLAD